VIAILAERDRFSACEQRIAREPRDVPTVAIVGASFTAGVGPNVPSLSWAAVLARTLHWNAVIYGVPGVGYVSPAPSRLGPVTRMLGEVRLRGLVPALVIVQAGHNDVGVPSAVERQRVRQVIEEIRAQAPHARIALLTVFAKPYASNLPELDRTDRAIVTAARAVDRKAIIMDPLAGRWKFTRFGGIDLHPTAAGDAQIERKVAAILRSHGIGAAPLTATAPMTCQYSVGVGGHATASAGTSKDALAPRGARVYLRRRRPLSLPRSE
jgi:lysophospholipase L1-like esterase